MNGANLGKFVRNRILVGDVRRILRSIPGSSIDTVITSPPYFRLRNYQQVDQIGLEEHVDGWVDELLLVARGLKRVIKPTGSLWLNLGDTFSRSKIEGAASKSLLLAPERLALAMIRDGWILRNKVVWAKPNPMPTSVKDRLSCTWEVVYFFTLSERYFFDLDAIRIPHVGTTKPHKRPSNRPRGKAWSVPEQWRGPSTGSHDGLDRLKASGLPGHPLGKNPGDVWQTPTAGYRGAHHAVYPERLIERPLLATCPEKVCVNCGTPWLRAPHRAEAHLVLVGQLRKSCDCPTDAAAAGVVLDPFMGSGTTAVVAERLGRDWLGVELNPEFAALAADRIAQAGQAQRATAPRPEPPAAA